MFDRLFNAFDQGGKKLYHVGGSVRDLLLGKSPKDYDFTTDALPTETQEILSNANIKHWPLGEKFGTIAASVALNGEVVDVEVTTHRKDMTPGRHPDVSFTDNLEDDLARRDFTINSMAMTQQGRIIDPFDGQKDLAQRLIKTTGNPYERFSEDPLRMLRAARFVSQLGFGLNGTAKNVIREYAHAILTVSRERWLEEMNKLLVGPNVLKALYMLADVRLFGYILPEAFSLTIKQESKLPSKDLWHHVTTVVTKSPPRVNVRWAALLHDIAKPQTRMEKAGEVHFFQHEYLGAEMIEGVARRLKMGNTQRRAVKGLAALHQRVGDAVSRRNNPPVSKSALRRIIRDCDVWGCDINDLIDLFEADCSSKRKEVLERQGAHARLLREALGEIKEEELRPKLPSGIGNAIMDRLELKPGPEIGEIKNKMDEMLMIGLIDPSMSIEDIIAAYLKGEEECT
jgi:poly(A) polymerase